MYDREYIQKNIKYKGTKKELLTFEICGKEYKLSEYEHAVNENESELSEQLSLLQEFPYSVRNIKNEEKTKQMPVSIIYDGNKFSLYDFFERIRNFEKQIPNLEEINGLELKYELIVKHTGFQNQDDFYLVIINTFRVFQDLYEVFSSARFALLKAQRILHLKSSIDWKDGKEQLLLRSIWLNNAIVLYNSCFDKLLQTIWIGRELYIGYKNKKMTVALCRKDMGTNEGLEKVYYWCNYNNIKNQLPKDLENAINLIYLDKPDSVRHYANSIKHRGGMRYKNVFPFGQIYDNWENASYSSFNTRNEKDLDDVIEVVKEYHIAFRELTLKVLSFVMENFMQHGYFKGEV